MQNGSGIMDHGGAIYNAGTLTMRDSLVIGNMAESGGGIYNAGNLSIETSLITENLAAANTAHGGGIFNAGTLSITGSSVIDNTAKATADGGKAWGGGIYNIGMLWLDSSVVADNAVDTAYQGAFASGGGIVNYTNGVATIRNSTIANNIADEDGVGGILSHGTGTAITIDHSTIAGNLGRNAGGIWSVTDFTVSLRNTIVAGNFAQISEEGHDLLGQFSSAGHNLIGDSSGAGGFGATDILDVDPILGPLADNGGLTLTMALLPGSPAIDAGDNTGAPLWDQRGPGFPRIVNGTIDIGAFEVQATGAPAISPRLDFLLMLITADLFD